jgi:dipeptidyl aminopeptidase/acylaminoacyl peptidase
MARTEQELTSAFQQGTAAMAQRQAPFGSWSSPITSDLIVAESISLADVLLDGEDVYWIEGRPREVGRQVVVRGRPGASPEDVTPLPFNARTRVHEYGGGAVTVANSRVYFSHFADQRLYCLPGDGNPPQPLTPADAAGQPNLRFADGVIDLQRNRWIGVREDHRGGGREPVNTLVAIDLTAGGEGVVLAQGSEFYSSPRLSPDGTRLAWLSWNHPNMPWDGTQLWLAEITATGLANPIQVAGGEQESVFQPEWSPDGQLYFISDRSGWCNLYRLQGDKAVALCPRSAEFGQPQWTFGRSTYAFCSAAKIVCTWTEAGLGRLGILDPAKGELTPLNLPFTDFSAVRANGDRVAFLAGSPADPPAVVLLDLRTGKHEVLRWANTVSSRPEIRRCFSRPQPIEFPTENGLTAHGLFYPPQHPDHQTPAAERPPLLVKCHGGPTGSASSTLDLRIQYWTSRGIAVLDVNYGGSTGYGREYRQRLNGTWGVVDVDDCVNGAKHLARLELVDGSRVVISGGSAGGYTTLAALAFRDFFRGGASHYGVSDLEALVHDTHKFESRYLDRLIGPWPEKKEIYQQRSPVHFADKVKAPVIFFQGDEDQIVPPNQTEVMVEALRRQGVPVGYLLFSGEQHGFRKGANIQRALDAELYFYSILVFRIGLTF